MDRFFKRTIAVYVVGFTIAVLASACGGFSDEEATARCDQEEATRAGGGCFTPSAYDECVAAYTECGEDVTIDDGCPPSFVCPD